MTDRRKRLSRDFRLVQAAIAIVLLGAAWWLLGMEWLGLWRWAISTILAFAALSAVIDILNGPFGRIRR
jgi:hypothetical protein